MVISCCGSKSRGLLPDPLHPELSSTLELKFPDFGVAGAGGGDYNYLSGYGRFKNLTKTAGIL